jgi:hypothetical protein
MGDPQRSPYVAPRRRYGERSQTKWKWVGQFLLPCLRYSRAVRETAQSRTRSVGEPAEGSLQNWWECKWWAGLASRQESRAGEVSTRLRRRLLAPGHSLSAVFFFS